MPSRFGPGSSRGRSGSAGLLPLRSSDRSLVPLRGHHLVLVDKVPPELLRDSLVRVLVRPVLPLLVLAVEALGLVVVAPVPVGDDSHAFLLLVVVQGVVARVERGDLKRFGRRGGGGGLLGGGHGGGGLLQVAVLLKDGKESGEINGMSSLQQKIVNNVCCTTSAFDRFFCGELTTRCCALNVDLTGHSAQPSFSRCICSSSSRARW